MQNLTTETALRAVVSKAAADQSTVTDHSLTTNSESKPNVSGSELAVNRAVTTLKTVFSGWRATFKTDTEFQAYRREFLLAMIEFRITSEDQLERGISRARHEAANGREFMPSGAQFAGWCQPTPGDLGIGTFEQCYLAAIRGQWEKIHPAFQHVARSFDMYSMRRLADRDARREFRPLFDQVIYRVSSGEQFERIAAIAKTSTASTNPTPARIQRGNEALSSLLAMVGGKRTGA